ncbi:MAG: hypothetical protein JSU96_06600 [Acidobacteriota bacterium]|nr:MAG: hypothetical protein JSU96_06600 [Acidobacteriota bacterium]
MRRNRSWLVQILFGALLSSFLVAFAVANPLKVGVFSVDASPPVGSPLAYDLAMEVTVPLSCSGIVLLGDDQPVVLCAVDWIGIGNEGQEFFRQSIAEAVGTDPGRVALHTLHQHDAPRCDFTVDRLLNPFGINDQFFDSDWARTVIERTAQAVREAVNGARPVTHLGTGLARVEKIASNRRILGEDGKVAAMRWTACDDPELRAKPAGLIDPNLRMISFWNGEDEVAALTYYATHPQSYYRTGGANPDFPGLARNEQQERTGIPHIHFTGASGNIGAGKWNDGEPANRAILADRLRSAMEEAWKRTVKVPVEAVDLSWDSFRISLPAAPDLDREGLQARLNDSSASAEERLSAAGSLAWLERTERGDETEVSCLKLGPSRILHMPGELFVEYQLAAQEMRRDLFVAMAAYGDYAPGYIGTKIAYQEGGYETRPGVSLVAPDVEAVLTAAIRRLLDLP